MEDEKLLKMQMQVWDRFKRVGLAAEAEFPLVASVGILSVAGSKEVAITVDTLVEGVHFPTQTTARSVGYKSLAVNLSDIAAMGARPLGFNLSLVMPASWDGNLDAFIDGLLELASVHSVKLVSVQVARGPLTITIQAFGEVIAKPLLLRSGAMIGDQVCVTGSLGDAGMGLKIVEDHSGAYQHISGEHRQYLTTRLERPTPRITEGLLIAGIGHAAIDISDGFAADLQHILEASGLGAVIHLSNLPRSEALRSVGGAPLSLRMALSAGDDYELCFTAAKQDMPSLNLLFTEKNVTFTCVGEIVDAPGLHWINRNGHSIELSTAGYEHFINGTE